MEPYPVGLGSCGAFYPSPRGHRGLGVQPPGTRVVGSGGLRGICAARVAVGAECALMRGGSSGADAAACGRGAEAIPALFCALGSIMRKRGFAEMRDRTFYLRRSDRTGGDFYTAQGASIDHGSALGAISNGAIAFLREHEMRGKMLVFFDRGEMVIFHLPDCPPSIDGRLDTCYSRELVAAHWKFYNGDPFDRKILNPDEADLALLPSNLAGAKALAKDAAWKPVYFDDTVVILARNRERFPALAHLTLPVEGPKSASSGRAAFADHNPRWK